MNIDSIITRRIVTVDMDDSLRVIHDIFNNVKFHHLLVTDKHRLVGIISDRDLLKSLSPYMNTPSELPRDVATLRKKAHQIMIRHPITIREDANVSDAISLFVKNRVSCLPVVNEAGSAKGILSWRDIIRVVHELHLLAE